MDAPNSLSNVEMISCNAVYNVVLTNGHSSNVNGYYLLHLDMNILLVFFLNYFGSKKIIQDLTRKPGWSNGCVVISDNQFIRNYIDGEIVGVSGCKQYKRCI